MRVVPFHPSHVSTLILQPMQAMPPIAHAEAEALAAAGPAFSAVGEDGTVHAVCGVIPQWKGRAIAWGMIGMDSGAHFVRITREVRRFLDTCGIRRIEAAVDANFPAAIRWIEMLGFTRETPRPMAAYGLNGEPAYLYVRVTE